MGEQEKRSVSTTRKALEEFFRQGASLVSEGRSQALRLGLNLSEETLTELILFQMAADFGSEVYVRAFSKREEHSNGADWEWCFTSFNPIGHLRIRVQAKALYFPSSRYDALHFTAKDEKQTQLETFIERCSAAGLPGLYCFYNYKHPSLKQNQGVTIADALNVRHVADRSLEALLPISLPWQRLVSHVSDELDDKLPFLVHHRLEKLRGRGGRKLEPIPQPDKEAPDYVDALVRGPSGPPAGPPPGTLTHLQTSIAGFQWDLEDAQPHWERAMQARNPHLAGVVLFVDRSSHRAREQALVE